MGIKFAFGFGHGLVLGIDKDGLVLDDEFDHFEVVDDFIGKKEFDKFSVVFLDFRVLSLNLVFVKVKSVSIFQELNKPIIDNRVINLVVNDILLNKLFKGGYFIRQRA